MVRHTIAIRGPPKDESSPITIQEKEVDLSNQEQITEQFLTQLNPKGQVPVLSSPAKTITDSLDITFYLAGLYPSLIPASHKDKIMKYLHDLHALNYFSLTFFGRQNIAGVIKASIQKLLDGDISDRYREALKYKLEVNESEKISGLKDGVPEQMNERARLLMKEFESLLPGKHSDSNWLFGIPQPSALDAHLIVFIARMMDVGRNDIIPDALAKYADVAMQQSEWKDVMQGRRTLPSH